MGLAITAQVLSSDRRNRPVDPQTGVVESYGILVLLSAEKREGGSPDWELHRLFVDAEVADVAMVGKMVSVPVRAYTDRRTQHTKLTPVDGAAPTLVNGLKPFVSIDKEWIPAPPAKGDDKPAGRPFGAGDAATVPTGA